VSKTSKLNRHILEKLEGYDTDKRIKEFTIEILRFEQSVADQEKPNYTDDYERLIKKFVEA
jgi:hypothetical protein